MSKEYMPSLKSILVVAVKLILKKHSGDQDVVRCRMTADDCSDGSDGPGNRGQLRGKKVVKNSSPSRQNQYFVVPRMRKSYVPGGAMEVIGLALSHPRQSWRCCIYLDCGVHSIWGVSSHRTTQLAHSANTRTLPCGVWRLRWRLACRIGGFRARLSRLSSKSDVGSG